MLVQMVVENLVIVARAELRPEEGLTVISGETGAGKSLLLDALALMLGARGQAKLVGPRSDACSVTGVFALSDPLAAAVEEACGIPTTDGNEVILRRRLTRQGRSQAWINDTPVTLAALKAVGGLLVDIRVQHEHLRLGDPVRQMELLDAYGHVQELAEHYRTVHRACLDLERELRAIENGEQASIKELDYLLFQQREFRALDPQPGESAELEERVAVLSSSDEWRQRAEEAAIRLADDEEAVTVQLGRLADRLSTAPDSELRSAGELLQQAQALVQDAAATCAGAVDRLAGDPEALALAQERLDAWYDLMRKHGRDEASVLAAWADIDRRIEELQGLDERRERVAGEMQRQLAQRVAIGTDLAAARRAAFAALAKRVHRELADLGMPKARLSLHEAEGAPQTTGLLHQEFRVCTNPGLPPDAIAAIASGGESARLTLALAVALAEQDATPVLVFDEVDSGVGGRLGVAIGTKLATLGSERSVLAVTHTPQVAAAADTHYRVVKKQGDAVTEVLIEALDEDARRAEIADMLGGGGAAAAQAEALLAEAAR